MCENFRFSSFFLCVLGLSTVANSSISIVYPDFDDLHCKVVLSHTIQPRQYYQSSSVCCNSIKILFCNLNSGSTKFKGNHFVPLLKNEGKKKVTKNKQVPGCSTNTKRSKIDTFESAFRTPKLNSFFTPLTRKTNIDTSGFVSLTKKSTIRTINSSSCTRTVSTNASVSCYSRGSVKFRRT